MAIRESIRQSIRQSEGHPIVHNWTPANVPQAVYWASAGRPDSLYQSTDATTPVTDPNQPVGWPRNLIPGRSEQFTQGTTSAKPTYKVGADGIAYFDFDGGDWWTGNAAALAMTNNASAVMVFASLRTAGGTTQLSVFVAATATAPAARYYISRNMAVDRRIRLGGRRLDADSFQSVDADGTFTANAWGVDAGLLDYQSTLARIYHNGTAVASNTSFQTAGNASATNSANTRIGADSGSTAATFLVGRLRDIVICIGRPSDADILRLNQFCGAGVGVSI